MIKSLLISLCLFACGSLYAQDPAYLHLDRSKGLPSASVYDVAEDLQGKIWLGTDVGLVGYDGLYFKTYSFDSLHTGACSALLIDNAGSVWFENFDGYLFYLRQDTLRALAHKHPPTGFAQFGILGRYVLVPAKGGFDVYNSENGRFHSFISYTYTYIITASVSNGLWYVLSDRGLISFDKQLTLKSMSYKAELDNKSLLMHASGRNLSFIYKYNDRRQLTQLDSQLSITQIPFQKEVFVQGINSIEQTLWISTNLGAWKMEQNKTEGPFWKQFSISKVFQDSRGLMWVSTLNDGLLLIQDARQSYTSLLPHSISSLSPMPGGYLFGTQEGKLMRLTPDFRKASPFAYTGIQKPAQVLMHDQFNHLMMVAGNGFQMFDEKSGQLLFQKDIGVKSVQKVNDTLFAFAASGQIGPLSVRRADSLQVRFYPITKQVRGRAVCVIGDTLFYATNTGLYRSLCNGEDLPRILSGSVPFKEVIAVHGRVYALSNMGRLYVVSDNQVVQSSLGELIGETLFKTAVYDSFLYLLGKNAVYVLPPGHDPLKPLAKINLYTPASEVESMLAEKDRLVLVSYSGATTLPLQAQQLSPHKPVLLLEGLRAGSTIYKLPQAVTLDPESNSVEILYNLLSYGSHSEPEVFYQINEGLWQKSGSGSRTLRLSALAPDRYVLRFALDTTAGAYASQIAVFTIEKHFWQTMGFQVFILGVVLLSVAGFFRLREHRLRQKMALELELSQSTLTALRSQMNPHFFFNALNTIQAYIFRNDKHKAAGYLSKFSKLTRMILEQSGEEQHPLSAELTALTLYLELEKMRFDEDFSFFIHVDPSLDPGLLSVPAMLLQPYVENAVKHGLLHKPSGRKVELRFTRVGTQLLVEIKDNGIGRKRAMELRQSREQEQHKSFATEATAKRIAVLNKGRDKPIVINTIDKTDEEGRPSGTLVRIILPLA